MYHRRSRIRLNVKPHHARSMERNLVTSLILYEAIRTTRKRAKVIQPTIDRLITLAKKKEPQLAIRAINRVVTDKNASRKLMEVLRVRFADRTSGYTTAKIAGARKGDGADLVDLTFVGGKMVIEAAPAVEKKPKVAKKTAKSTKKTDDSASTDSSAS